MSFYMLCIASITIREINDFMGKNIPRQEPLDPSCPRHRSYNWDGQPGLMLGNDPQAVRESDSLHCTIHRIVPGAQFVHADNDYVRNVSEQKE